MEYIMFSSLIIIMLYLYHVTDWLHRLYFIFKRINHVKKEMKISEVWKAKQT